MAIVSVGVIVFRFNAVAREQEFLLICRKDTLGFVDFLRGKYIAQNKNYIMNMLFQMTIKEKQKLKAWTFDALWRDLWHGDVDISGTSHLRSFDANNRSSTDVYPRQSSWIKKTGSKKNEEYLVRERFNLLVKGVRSKDGAYNLESLIEECEKNTAEYPEFIDPEWGFPKGRQNSSESEMAGALREFQEETGIHPSKLRVIDNISPLEEIFTGSNYKSYCHKYFLAEYIDIENDSHKDQTFDERATKRRRICDTDAPAPLCQEFGGFQRSEVSRLGWYSYKDCLNLIRPYNFEKLRVINTVREITKTFHFQPSS
jgi:8-oxo-dGTP pyrophosphatase MutT (NUDIX family)